MILLFSLIHVRAQIYHSVASYSYSSDGLYAAVIKSNPTNPKIIYLGAQNVNSNYKGFFDTYDLTSPDTVKRTKRLGILTDSFGVTDFVFRGSDIYAIGSKGLQIMNTSDPLRPSLTKSIRTFKDGNSTSFIGYMTASIYIEGNKLHYGGFDYKLLDISNLDLPTKIGARSYSGINSGSIQRIAPNKVVVGDGYDLKIFDVSAAPTITSTTLSGLVGDPVEMLYHEPSNVLYTAFETSTRKFLYSVNMSNNSKLDSFNYLSVPGFNPISHSGMCLFKDTLYIGTSNGVALLDVSTPGKYKYIGKLSTEGSSAVFVNEEYLITNDKYNLKFYRRGPALANSIDKEIDLIRCEIYPNPTTGLITINSNQNINKIEVYDNLGNLVYTKNDFLSTKQSNLNLNYLSKGIYYMNITSTNDEVSVNKIFINE